MTGFFMKCNTELRWVDVLNIAINLLKIINKHARATSTKLQCFINNFNHVFALFLGGINVFVSSNELYLFANNKTCHEVYLNS